MECLFSTVVLALLKMHIHGPISSSVRIYLFMAVLMVSMYK